MLSKATSPAINPIILPVQEPTGNAPMLAKILENINDPFSPAETVEFGITKKLRKVTYRRAGALSVFLTYSKYVVEP